MRDAASFVRDAASLARDGHQSPAQPPTRPPRVRLQLLASVYSEWPRRRLASESGVGAGVWAGLSRPSAPRRRRATAGVRGGGGGTEDLDDVLVV